ncbi:unnamed protein product [Euphydryas editha]|uniref:Uncharacterized protein n=1 Tax=Euphydryas editha TaxID=104508 RepID=A0AAU9TZH6_EUPED|nr:unnamed protein product [Euphydryas editha]
MKCFILISFLICCISPSLCTIFRITPETFQFGSDIGNVEFYDSGTIGVFQKHVEVPIPILPCKKLTYVRVDIYNQLASPNVSLINNNDISVLIRYRLLQHSKSNYEIIAKYVPIPFCVTIV